MLLKFPSISHRIILIIILLTVLNNLERTFIIINYIKAGILEKGLLLHNMIVIKNTCKKMANKRICEKCEGELPIINHDKIRSNNNFVWKKHITIYLLWILLFVYF